MTKTEHALALAAQGFFVFPLRPKGEHYVDRYGRDKISNGKVPRHLSWQTKATRDAEIIRRYWTANPECNIGVHCGRYGDEGKALLVVDVDVKDGKPGDETLDDLQMINGDFPATRVAITPTGGRHIYFIVEKSVRLGANILGPGLDVRSGNSYVVGPGSTIDGREYAWQE